MANLPDEAERLQEAANAMTATAKTIDDVQKVLTAVGTAIDVAGKLIGFVAGGG